MALQTAATSSSTSTAASAPISAVPGLHWPEYLIESGCLALFMVSVCIFGSLFEHPASPVRQLIDDPLLRRVPMGLMMGLTAMALIYSPLGQRSGAHMNPATTLAFLRLGKITRLDAAGYMLAQLAGGIIGVQAAALFIRQSLGHPSVNYLTTVPGMDGVAIAFVAEATMSCLLMLVILAVSNRPSIARFTGLCAGLLIMTFIVAEAPISGMSLNPARTLGSAFAAGTWSAFWLYCTAPPLGMLAAAQLYAFVVGHHTVKCAKLQHPTHGHCHFSCSASATAAR